MLIVNRRVEEKIIIETPEGNVMITVLRIGGKDRRTERVRLGFEAPEEIKINRAEVLKKEAADG